MIQNKSDYKRYIKIEKDFYYDSYPIFTKELKTILKFIKLYRKVEYYHNCRKDPLGKIYFFILNHYFEKKSIQYSIFLPLNTIEEGLCIIHLGPIYINQNTKIGKYLKIHPMTTISKNIGTTPTSPRIGNHVWIGPGSRIIGNVTIGDNTVIGANSTVTKSFSNNLTIAGSPAKIIKQKGYSDYFKKNE